MNSTVNRPLILGTGDSGDIKMSLKTLQRHFGCFGSSGSGKTVMSKVLVEELARNGIPVIAFDPQGDIASLALLADTDTCLLYTSPSPRDKRQSRMPSSA